jgi:hypothetical protein
VSHAAIQFLKKDPDLGKIIRSVGPYSITLEKNPYRSLVEAIITQQLSGKAANPSLPDSKTSTRGIQGLRTFSGRQSPGYKRQVSQG